MTVDGSEHYLAITLPSRESVLHEPAVELLRAHRARQTGHQRRDEGADHANHSTRTLWTRRSDPSSKTNSQRPGMWKSQPSERNRPAPSGTTFTW